jgi:hypothetical protein
MNDEKCLDGANIDIVCYENKIKMYVEIEMLILFLCKCCIRKFPFGKKEEDPEPDFLNF